MEKYIEVLSWSFGSSQPGTYGEPEFDGEVTFDSFEFQFSDAPNPAVGIALGHMFGDQYGAVSLDDGYLEYGDDGDVVIELMLADGTTTGPVKIDDANFNDIRSGLANILDDGDLDITPITIVPTDADFII